MGRLPQLSAQKLTRTLKRLGFELVWQKGSHQIYKHPDGRQTTVPVHRGKDIPRGLLHDIILHDLEMTVDEFVTFL